MYQRISDLTAMKPTLIAKYNKEISLLKSGIEAYNKVIAGLSENKWDGKKFNVRVLNFINEILKPFQMVAGKDSVSWAKDVRRINVYLQDRCISIKNEKKFRNVEHVYHEAIYVSFDTFTFDIIVNDDERIMLKETIGELNTQIESFNKRIKETQDIIDNYDAYDEECTKMYDAIAEFQKRVPYRLRANITVRNDCY